MHVHVVCDNGEAKFWIEPTVELASNSHLSSAKINEARRIIEERFVKLKTPGKSISAVEVTNISLHGFWMLAAGEEMFLSFDNFPFFKNAPVAKILNVTEPLPGHYYWPDLDVDLDNDIIKHPGRYPLKSK